MSSYKALQKSPAAEKYPHAYRWYKHITTYDSEFSTLPGDPSKAYTTYGPDQSDIAINTKAPAKAPQKAEEDDDDDDLFGSDDEEEDEETVKKREANLAAYRKKKEGKEKPAAKSIITMDVKPWGTRTFPPYTGH